MKLAPPSEIDDRPRSPWQKLQWFLWKASMFRMPRGDHITRYAMYQKLRDIGRLLEKREGRILSISHSSNLVNVMGLRALELVEANYPQHNMLSLQFRDNAFDFVISDQVLEHVEGSPQDAIDECRRILKPGGIAIHTTCFINPIHAAPGDYWRFTPYALEFLHKNWTILECGGWGNFMAWSIVRCGLRFQGIPLASWHPLNKIATRNEPEWPIVTWVVAQK